MPRVTPSLLREARAIQGFLPLLLRECRDLPSARNELRWLRVHAYESHGLPPELPSAKVAAGDLSPSLKSAIWRTLTKNVARRSKGEPLQYILGTQPFGNLEILCRRDVLIPRPETEAYTSRLASILESFPLKLALSGKSLRILDLCTGTGCIPLLLHSLLKPATNGGTRKIEIIGVDISESALALAHENVEHNIGENLLHLSAVKDVSFRKGDIINICNQLETPNAGALQPSALGRSTRFDVLVANPPYISRRDYMPGGTTSRSVRRYEPELALLGDGNGRHGTHNGDLFYLPLIEVARKVQASIVVLETGDDDQALRVRSMAIEGYGTDEDGMRAYVELWDDEAKPIDLADRSRRHARSVVIWTRDAQVLRKAARDGV